MRDDQGWVWFCVVVVLFVSCSSSGGSRSRTATSPTTSITSRTSPPTSKPVVRPSGPVADLSQEITGGSGPYIASGGGELLVDAGYVAHEFVASGTASSYKAEGALSGDGRWTFRPAAKAAYRTRVLIRRPSDASKFSGTVVVEWLNVSGGIDAQAEYASLREELVRRGDVWVGVSAQQIGVMGGPVLVKVPGGAGTAGVGLRKLDPARYRSLDHPGDGYSFDMFTQVARAVRAGGAAMGGLHPQRILAAGESQSAFALVTYANGLQPLTRAFDGFFIHSRGSAGLPLVGPGRSADLSVAIGAKPTIIRTDLGVPVLDVQSESDLLSPLNSLLARQPDTKWLRLWEVTGTAHADLHLIGAATAKAIDCGAPINNGPMHLVAKAGLRALDQWVRTGRPPPKAARIEVSSGVKPAIRRDVDGIALGGIRTPLVDVPVASLSGVAGPNPSLLCILLGSTKPLSPARLAALYPSRSAYRTRFDADADRTIKAGFVLDDDRQALLAYAEPSRVG